MANMFSHEGRIFKFDVLVQLARQAYEGDIDEAKIQAYCRNLVSMDTPRVRCCVYKEREILRQRVRLAMGKMADEAAEYNPRQIVQVIDAACDGCSIKKIRVTDNCRKCMAKSCVAACRFDAMHIGINRSEIDYSKCKECGACANACPYNAIVVTERPCFSHCPVQAIHWDEHGIAVIDEEKCINCGQCEGACPFGAIEDISWVVPVVQLLRMGTPAYAVVAPSIQGQFDNTTLPQIMKAIEMLGFEKCYEVAIGADAVAQTEYLELKEHKAEGKPLTTSCCPAFVNMLKIHFPKQYAENKSTTVTPMMAIARKLKKEHPDHGIVFIGPCLAKKQEAMQEATAVDYVLTFEELAALLVAKGINPPEVEVENPELYPSNYGRNFAGSGGVAGAVAQAAKEAGDGPYSAYMADGAFECKKQLTLLRAGKFKDDILEGMCCVGGCIAGPASISDTMTVKSRRNKENMNTDKKTIQQSLEIFSFDGVDMNVTHKI
ncbi:MAG: monomeric [FeFe] hydrogenase [Solobacterium sp.]|nr:monomeric [FeFe] hydrogenase [Solobacterium sp.]